MKLDEYIRKNRSLLDAEKPDEDFLWTGISQSLNTKKKKSQFLSLKVAASILIILGLSFVTYQIISIKNNQQLILAKIDPKLAKQEAQFQHQINAYYKVLEKSDYNQELLTTKFKDLEYIDTLINKYSEDLSEHGPNPKLIYSLMDLYQKKIRLLDRMLNEIEKNQKYENDQTNI